MALRKLGVEEWLIKIIESVYRNAQSRVRVNDTFSDDFLTQVGLHKGSILTYLFFIIVLEELSRENRSAFHEELRYVDDLELVKHLRA